METLQIKKYGLYAALFIQFVVLGYCCLHTEVISSDENAEVKFRLTGYDPKDFFRGEYIRLNFLDDKVEYDSDSEAMHGDIVNFRIDSAGFAVPTHFSIEPESEYYLKVEHENDRIKYPFSKYWMNERDCPIAEEIIFEALRENRSVYAVVKLYDGEGYLERIEIDGDSIEDLVEEQRFKESAEPDTPQVDSITLE